MSQLCGQLEMQGELGSIVDAEEIFAKLVTSWSRVREIIAGYH
jgi:hypothetical protein